MIACKQGPVQDRNTETSSEGLAVPIHGIDTVVYPLDKKWVTGDFNPSERDDFVVIDKKYADREGLYLHREAYEAFQKMWTVASADGITLVIRSATRNHSYQKGIWERKWTGETLLEGTTNAQTEISDPVARSKAILRYSSMPGTSRHHWGTDVDFNAFENEYFQKGGAGEAVYNWLAENAHEYGFCQVYSDKSSDNRSGYEMEMWHWSYLPLAGALQHYAETHLTDADVHGFKGSETAVELEVIKNYVLGINQQCMH